MKEEKKILRISGKIDSSNAENVEKDLMEQITGDDFTTIVVDASDLEYISSAGLRVLLKLKKTSGVPVRVEDASSEVYEIFEVTGFTEILDVHKKLRQIDVEGCEFLGNGAYGHVYRIDPETIAKIYNPGLSMEFVNSERESSRNAFLLGVPTAIAYDVVKCGDSYGVVYELLNAKTVAQHICDNPDKLVELGATSGKVLKELHSIEVPETSAFDSRKDIFRKWITQFEGIMTDEEYSITTEFIENLPERRTFLHGDFNSKNVMLRDGEPLLIDVGDAAYGHPVFDIAMLFLAYIFLPNSPMDDKLKRGFLGFDKELAPRLLASILGTYFGTRDQDEIKNIIDKIMPLASLYAAFQGTTTKRSTPETTLNGSLRHVFFPSLKTSGANKLDLSGLNF
ncbi:MAG: anti-sigma factor antagonist [Eubacterium sp.]|nr:anti-sigma factor antagonist [Eubacterium sp.]